MLSILMMYNVMQNPRIRRTPPLSFYQLKEIDHYDIILGKVEE